MLVLFVTANRRVNKLPDLEEASVKVDTLWILLRLSKSLSFLSNAGYEVLSQDLTEIGKMLGGWIKHSAKTWSELVEHPVLGYPFEDGSSELEKVSHKHKDKAKSPTVRYTMKSPKIEAYFREKLEHPEKVVLIRTGAFYKAFFEDAMFLRESMHLQVKDLSADSEEVAINTCGFPVTALEKYRVKIAKLGKEVYVIE